MPLLCSFDLSTVQVCTFLYSTLRRSFFNMRINLKAVTKFARLSYFSHSVPSRQLSQQYVSETYNRHLEQSLKNPEEYWGEISENTIWTKVRSDRQN